MVKIFYVFMLIIGVSCSGCNREQADKVESSSESETMRTIVAVGDSLTAGFGINESESYPSVLEQKLQTAGYEYRVVNAGVSGETSSGTLSRMEWILTLEPDIVILETGANDGLRGIEPKLIEKNLREMLQILKDRDVVVVLAGMKMVWNLGPIYVAGFNGIYPRLAKDYDLIFMPFFLDGVAMKKALTLSDGIHPNAQGHKIITEKIYPYIVQAIEKKES